ncbi:hypothetical protein Mp_8g08830 [Marchantia polymorpha subsp. ruderalis]|uniref:Uncharacterized protein n=1 Tax=Marchantia polymorpha TaxID=3197 RepID=A0A2R6WRJ6_MARPO|nr:hypothetical protein MARPO_0063s0035 [Marchantia polymorpha]BBN19224.1 hypothetical protein Mp_8g08830 [Marchantia polymorpha subsp. ruderalis]|eukprot:PTQ36487.1 hypothetical protein MARPO_0063s0035 [Marchantia polymorpha]
MESYKREAAKEDLRMPIEHTNDETAPAAFLASPPESRRGKAHHTGVPTCLLRSTQTSCRSAMMTLDQNAAMPAGDSANFETENLHIQMCL